MEGKLTILQCLLVIILKAFPGFVGEVPGMIGEAST